MRAHQWTRGTFVAVAALALFVSLSAIPAPADTIPQSAATSAATAERIAGADRVATAAAIADHTFPDGAERVYLAGADRFADAMAGGVLSDGPLLLVGSCDGVPGVVTDAIERLDPARVVALGGGEAICDEVLSEAAEGRRGNRISGLSRYDTAIAISQEGFGDAEVVYLASGGDTPDAVSGGVLEGGPILLVPPDGNQLEQVADEVTRLDPDLVVALGGTEAVTDDQLDAAADDRATDRYAGVDRYATAAAIAEAAFPTERGAAAVYLANGETFVDALTAGTVTNGPILLVPACGDLADPAAAYLADSGAHAVIAVGGTEAVCDELLEGAAALPTPRLPRPDVFDPRTYDYEGETGPVRPVSEMEFWAGDSRTITADDPPYEGIHAENRVNVEGAPDAQLSDCHLPRGVRVLLRDTDGHVTVDRCSLGASATGLSVTVRNNAITTDYDGVTPTGGAHGRRSLVEYNLIERDGSVVDDIHHDGIQLWQGGNITIRRNWITGWETSAILIKSDLEMEPGDGPITDVLIEENYLANPTGFYSLYVRAGSFGRPTMVTVRDNAFGPGTPISAGPNPSEQATFVRDEATRDAAIEDGVADAEEWIVWYGNYDADTGVEIEPPGGWHEPTATS